MGRVHAPGRAAGVLVPTAPPGPRARLRAPARCRSRAFGRNRSELRAPDARERARRALRGRERLGAVVAVAALAAVAAADVVGHRASFHRRTSMENTR